MALVKGVNSYVLLAEANSYFENRLDADIWWTTDSPDLALVTATQLLDSENWVGVSAAATNNLAWPRSGTFKDTPRNRVASFTSTYAFSNSKEKETTVPREIAIVRKATYELALHLLNNKGLLNKGASVKGLKAGSIALDTIIEASTIPRIIRDGYADLIGGGRKSSSWEGW